MSLLWKQKVDAELPLHWTKKKYHSILSFHSPMTPKYYHVAVHSQLRLTLVDICTGTSHISST